MTEPKVSIVIPAYNAAETIARTVQSALNQTYQRTEIIVADDCSQDNTVAIVEEIAQREPKIRLIRSDRNGKVARTRNLAISASDGSFVAPLDADDIWHPSKIERQMARIGDAGFVYCPNRRIDADDRIIASSPFHTLDVDVFKALLLYNFVGNGSAALFRRAAIEEVGGYCENLDVDGVEDALLQVMVAKRWPIAAVPEYLVGYRLGRTGISSSPLRMYAHRLNMFDLVERTYADINPRLLAAARAWFMGQFAVRSAALARFGDCCRFATRALVTDPGVGLSAIGSYAASKGHAAFQRRIGPGADGVVGRQFYDVSPEVGIEAALRAAVDPRLGILRRRGR